MQKKLMHMIAFALVLMLFGVCSAWANDGLQVKDFKVYQSENGTWRYKRFKDGHVIHGRPFESLSHVKRYLRRAVRLAPSQISQITQGLSPKIHNYSIVSWSPDPLSNIKSALCQSKGGAFNIPDTQFFKVNNNSPLTGKRDSLQSNVKNALNTIRQTKNPNLIIAISSHGYRGGICDSDGYNRIRYDDFTKTVFREVKDFQRKYRKEVTIWFILNSCYSFSIKDSIDKHAKIRKSNKGDHTEKQRYKFRINLLTSAPADAVSYERTVWIAIIKTTELRKKITSVNSSLNTCPILSPRDWPYFCAFDRQNNHQVWSSYQAFSNKVSLTHLLEVLKTNDYSLSRFQFDHEEIKKFSSIAPQIKRILLRKGSQKDWKFLIRVMDHLSSIFREHASPLVPQLLEFSKANYPTKVRIKAIEALAKIAPKQQAKRIRNLAKKREKDVKVRVLALHSMRSFIRKDHPEDWRIVKSAFNDSNEDVKVAGAELLNRFPRHTVAHIKNLVDTILQQKNSPLRRQLVQSLMFVGREHKLPEGQLIRLANIYQSEDPIPTGKNLRGDLYTKMLLDQMMRKDTSKKVLKEHMISVLRSKQYIGLVKSKKIDPADIDYTLQELPKTHLFTADELREIKKIYANIIKS